MDRDSADMNKVEGISLIKVVAIKNASSGKYTFCEQLEGAVRLHIHVPIAA